jgi:hypothetical protein
VWQLWQMSKSYRCRPSDLLDLEDPFDAFRLDRAVWTFGTELTAELNKVEGKNDKEIRKKQERILKRWIPEANQMPTKFREPPNGERL